MKGAIGVPTGSGVKDAAVAGGVGAIGALIVGLSQRFLGTGIWGSLAGIVLAGSILKDGEGKIIATVLGYQLGQGVFGGITGRASSAAAPSSGEILV